MTYTDLYGVEFSNDKKELLKVPEDYKGIYKIPEGTISVEPDAFLNCKYITTIVIPKTVEDIFIDADFNTVGSCKSLSCFIVDSQNKNYFDIEGVLCEKWGPYVVAYPPAKKEIFVLPSNLQIGIAEWISPYILNYLKIENNHPYYVLYDGALYNKTMDTLIRVPIDRKEYVMPDSVKYFKMGAFSGCKKLVKIQLGLSFISSDDGGVSYLDFLDCTSLRTIKVHPENETYHTANGYLYEGYGFEYTHEDLIFCPQSYKPKTFWIPDTEKISEGAFTNCRYFNTPVLNSRNFIPLYIGANAFDGTPFYSNQENWKDGLLTTAGILIKVSEEYKQSKLVIPSTVHGIIVDNSINNDHITKIEIEDGYREQHFFNSGAINCPNLRTIKFPKTLSAWYLEHYRISLKENAPLLKKILIPKGMRDFFLMYSSFNLFELMIEYDSEGVETPIAPLSEEEWNFYKGPHLNGIPNYKQYENVKKEFLGGNALTGQQIATILESSVNNAGLQSCSLIGSTIDNVAKCFERDGYKFISKRFGDDFIYFIEPHKCKK